MMMNAYRILRCRSDPSHLDLLEQGDGSVGGESLSVEDQFTLEIPCADTNLSARKSGFDHSHLFPQNEEHGISISAISSITTHSDASSAGISSVNTGSRDQSTWDSSLLSRPKEIRRATKPVTPPSFLESLGIYAGGMCGMIPIDENRSNEENATCVDGMFFGHDDLRTRATFGETTIATTMTETEDTSCSTAPPSPRNFERLDDDDDIVKRIKDATNEARKASYVPIPYRSSIRKRSYLQKLFRERRARKQEQKLLDDESRMILPSEVSGDFVSGPVHGT